MVGNLLEKARIKIHTFRTNAHLILRVVLQETLDTTAWELQN
jgi:hypothetical protein